MALSPERREARRRHLVDAACALIRERGDAGFSMKELALRAGVSPATPYNLVGGRADVLRLVVRDEFERFGRKLAAQSGETPLRRLVSATALVVTHYEEDRAFYRGLFHAAFGSASPEVRTLMTREGRTLWRALVRAAIEAGEISDAMQEGPLTDVLLRAIAGAAQAWLAEDWSASRFRLEMTSAAGLVLAAAAAPALREALLAEVAACQAAIVADDPADALAVGG
jgi:AcrR family transcriptional regulator